MDAEIIVIGAGLSGLSTAYGLQKLGRKVLVLEADQKIGGCIKTDTKSGFMLERGPNSMMVNRSQVLDFIEELGLSPEIQVANEAASNRFIVKGGELHALPSGPIAFIKTPLFSMGQKLRLFKEPFIRKGDSNESIAQFVTRRLGQGFYDYAINPFVSGVYAGDPEQLMARAAVRKIWDLEDKHGSLIRGGFAMMRGKDRPEGRIKGRLLSFTQGMGSLPGTIAEKLGEAVFTSTPLERLERVRDQWRLITPDRHFVAKQVVIATPAKATAALLSPFNESAGAALLDIPYAPVAVVHLAFDQKECGHPLDGFGCLIPRKEQIQTLGALFSSTLFPGRSGEHQVLITCFIGGATFNQIRDWDDTKVLGQVLADATKLLQIQGDPVFSNVVRWDRAIPQYTHGHLERISVIKSTVEQLEGLHTRANWADGISVPDCIQNAMGLVQKLNA